MDRDGEGWPEAITGPADRKVAGWFACSYSRAMGFAIKMTRGLLDALPGRPRVEGSGPPPGPGW
ncbi:hypothetical protein [Candidatus Methylacidiphilum infernorum]|uniref:hypothetical protein n=1 Tax=Candidatus Methylacidiphilum infernorum TaxID=511746 RepID=UPI00164FA65C|nr:hypothetical protein [Candidatus Methylacidiphilum infernorum]